MQGNVTGRLLYNQRETIPLELPKSAATITENSSASEHEINLPELPESCISAILSFTSPRDVSRLSAVSKAFRSAAYDDSLWNKFIPQKCHQVLRAAVIPLAYSSKRQLYFLLCDSILIDGGTKRIWLERSTAKIGYLLSARELNIIWGNDQRFWRWVPRDDSRFEELAELLEVCWLDVSGGIDCTILSADTEYRVVFVLKFGGQSTGWHERPIKFLVTTPGGEHLESAQVLMETDRRRRRMYGRGWVEEVANDEWREGWKEVVAGEFTVTVDSSHIRFSMKEVESNQWKKGLLVDGVRIEPKPT